MGDTPPALAGDSAAEMPLPPAYLKNAGALVKAFGYWPGFHDAPVLAFHYAEEGAGRIGLTLRAHEMTPETDARGYFKLTKHHRVEFVFDGISNADLSQFLPENILFELRFSSLEEFTASGKFTVELDSAMGGDLCGSFCARRGK